MVVAGVMITGMNGEMACLGLEGGLKIHLLSGFQVLNFGRLKFEAKLSLNVSGGVKN